MALPGSWVFIPAEKVPSFLRRGERPPAHRALAPSPMHTTITRTFRKGDIVPASGVYVCVPCGYMQYFVEGASFIECVACLAGTPDGPEGYREDEQEFWQFVG